MTMRWFNVWSEMIDQTPSNILGQFDAIEQLYSIAHFVVAPPLRCQ